MYIGSLVSQNGEGDRRRTRVSVHEPVTELVVEIDAHDGRVRSLKELLCFWEERNKSFG